MPGHLKDPSGNWSIVMSLISLVIPVLAPRPVSFFTFWLRSSPYSRWASKRSQCSPCLMYRTSSVMLLCWLNGSITESSSWKNSAGGRDTVTQGCCLCCWWGSNQTHGCSLGVFSDGAVGIKRSVIDTTKTRLTTIYTNDCKSVFVSLLLWKSTITCSRAHNDT